MAYSRTSTASWLVAMVLALGACDFGVDDDPDLSDGCSFNAEPTARSRGHLGEGFFAWNCIRERDAHCGDSVWPAAIAHGARFEVAFESADASGSRIMAIGSVVDVGLSFEAQHEGEASLIAREADAVVDFVSVRVRPVTRITLSRPKGRATDSDGCDITDWSPGEGAFAEVGEGERIEVQAIPYDGATLLAGDLGYSWESLTPELLAVTPTGGRLAQLAGLAEGTGRVAVRAGNHEEIVEIAVHAAQTDDDTSIEDTTTGDDDGTTGERDEETTSSTGDDPGSSSDSGGESTGGSR